MDFSALFLCHFVEYPSCLSFAVEFLFLPLCPVCSMNLVFSDIFSSETKISLSVATLISST